MKRLLINIFNKFNFLKTVNIQTSIQVNNKKIIIPILGGLGYGNLFLSEPWMTKVLEKLKPVFNGNFIDVGVNIGQTLIKVYSVFEKVNYIGFEPNASCVHYCQRLLQSNSFSNCIILPVGIGEKNAIEKLDFYNLDATDPSASIISDFRPGEKIHTTSYVPIFNLDNFYSLLPDQANPLLKIDVEGAELEVLFGIREYLIKVKPIILIEVLPVYNLENHFRVNRNEKLVELLNGLDYLIMRIIKKNNVSIEILNDFGVHGNLENCDYLLCPRNMEKAIKDCFL